MTIEAYQRVSRLQRWSLAIAIFAALTGIGLGWAAPRAVLPAYQFAAFTCLAPAVGSILFFLIHRMSGGKWGEALAPFFAGFFW